MINSPFYGFRLHFGLKLGFIVVLVAVLSGCTNGILFQTPRFYQKQKSAIVHINPDSSSMTDFYQHKIKPDDKISVRFINNFDLEKGISGSASNIENGFIFLVDKDGYVKLPMIGKMHLEGKTKQEAQEALDAEYAKNFNALNVEVFLMDLSVSVQGEVGAPGVYNLQRERTSLVEVLSEAGGITQYGKKGVVKVIRGSSQGKEPEIFIFDMRQLATIESTDMIVRDKDVIYVEPRDVKLFGEAITPYFSISTVFNSLGTITLIILRFVGP